MNIRIYGKKLKKAIKNIGLSQVKIAKKISTNQCTISNILKTGKTSDIMLQKIVDALNEEQKIEVDEKRTLICKLDKPYTYNDFFKC